jgi:hypothetical protein
MWDLLLAHDAVQDGALYALKMKGVKGEVYPKTGREIPQD